MPPFISFHSFADFFLPLISLIPPLSLLHPTLLCTSSTIHRFSWIESAALPPDVTPNYPPRRVCAGRVEETSTLRRATPPTLFCWVFEGHRNSGASRSPFVLVPFVCISGPLSVRLSVCLVASVPFFALAVAVLCCTKRIGRGRRTSGHIHPYTQSSTIRRDSVRGVSPRRTDLRRTGALQTCILSFLPHCLPFFHAVFPCPFVSPCLFRVFVLFFLPASRAAPSAPCALLPLSLCTCFNSNTHSLSLSNPNQTTTLLQIFTPTFSRARSGKPGVIEAGMLKEDRS
jgi:hypothetical protein